MPPQQRARDIEVLHGRIDRLTSAVGELTSEVRESNALCKVCRPRVLGNGGESFDTRLARVEESQIPNGDNRLSSLEITGTVSAWWATKLLTLVAVVSTAAGTIASLVMQWMNHQGQ